ncbi:MAG: hypothetical protein QM752_00300 [Gammaproteobacteria bacterium]
MAEHSINYPQQFINHLESQEAIMENLTKARALLDAALEGNILDLPPSVIHTYFWVVSDFIENAEKISESILNTIQSQNCAEAINNGGPQHGR